MKQKILKYKSLLIFAVKLAFLVFYLFSFTYGRFFVTLLFFILSIADVVMKKAGRVFIDLSIAFILFIVANPALYFYYQVEELRFHILEKQYNQVIEENLSSFNECAELNHQDINNSLLCDDSKVFYMKENDSVLALFSTGNTGNVTGYLYCSDKDAWKLAEQYDFYNKIDDHWAVFKMYPLKEHLACLK